MIIGKKDNKRKEIHDQVDELYYKEIQQHTEEDLRGRMV